MLNILQADDEICHLKRVALQGPHLTLFAQRAKVWFTRGASCRFDGLLSCNVVYCESSHTITNQVPDLPLLFNEELSNCLRMPIPKRGFHPQIKRALVLYCGFAYAVLRLWRSPVAWGQHDDCLMLLVNWCIGCHRREGKVSSTGQSGVQGRSKPRHFFWSGSCWTKHRSFARPQIASARSTDRTHCLGFLHNACKASFLHPDESHATCPDDASCLHHTQMLVVSDGKLNPCACWKVLCIFAYFDSHSSWRLICQEELGRELQRRMDLAEERLQRYCVEPRDPNVSERHRDVVKMVRPFKHLGGTSWGDIASRIVWSSASRAAELAFLLC